MTLLGTTFTSSAADLPHVTRAMRDPDFWALHQASPERVVMTAAEIAAFNRGLHAQGLTEDLASLPPVLSGPEVRAGIEGLSRLMDGRELFRDNGLAADGSAHAAWAGRMALERLDKPVRVRYGFTVAFTHERILPTEEPLYESPGDINFDQLQNSGLDPGTPVAVLHESSDGKWLFIRDGIASGWVKRGNIAFAGRWAWLRHLRAGDSGVVVSARAALYLDRSMARPAAVVRMGTRLRIRRVTRRSVEIFYPLRHGDGTVRFAAAFIDPRDIIRGVLPYTQRMAFVQAFKLLDAPYGWGDMNGGQDCSRFIQMVFATMGLHLPRNSGEQGRSGQALAGLNEAVGGLTVLQLKGHVMLFLGNENGRPYAIHAAWAYRRPGPEGEVTEPLRRVVVSDLSLGEGTSRRSLLERIVAVRFLKNGGPGEEEKDNH